MSNPDFDYVPDARLPNGCPAIDVSRACSPRKRTSTVYRVEFYEDDGTHGGYRYYASRAAARATAAEYRRRNNGRADVCALIYEPSKEGLLHLLNHCCSHPDNG